MSSSCGVCLKPCDVDSDQAVKCGGTCDRFFHQRCIKDDVEGKKTRSNKDWKCKDCRKESSSTQSSASSAPTPHITKDFLVKILEEFKAEVFGEFKSFRTEMGELSTSVSFVSDKLDENAKLFKEFKDELAAVKRENAELRNQMDNVSDELYILRDKVRALEQYSRKNNIEISGIPATQRENVQKLVMDVGSALGIDVKEQDISAAHRVPSFNTKRIPALVVQFISRTSREDWLSKFREMKELSANQVNPSFPKHKVYINEHLCPDNKVFLARLKAKCKEVGYLYAWCREGKFFVRKAQGDSVRKINSYEEMDQLK